MRDLVIWINEPPFVDPMVGLLRLYEDYTDRSIIELAALWLLGEASGIGRLGESLSPDWAVY